MKQITRRDFLRGTASGMLGLSMGIGTASFAGAVGNVTVKAEEEKMTLQMWTTNRDILDNDEAWYVKKIEEAFNVEIEMKYRNEGSTDYQEWLTLSMAGGDAPDWFRDQAVSYSMLQDFVDDGVVAELDRETIEENMPNLMAYYEKYSDIFGDDPLGLYELDGKIYAIPDAYPSLTQFCMMAYRKDWLDALGLEVPTTLDEMEEVFYQFTYNNPDGNGIDDTYGYVGITGTPCEAFSPIFGAYGIYPGLWYAKEDGTITRGELETDRMKEALTYIKKLYDEGVIDPEWMTVDYEGARNKVISSVVGSSYQNWLSIQTSDGWYSALYDATPDAELVVSYGPVGPYGDQGILQFNPLAGVGLVFSKHMEDEPEKLVKYLQVFDTIAGDTSWYEGLIWGEEGVTYTIDEDGNRSYTEEYSTEETRINYGFGTDYAFPSLEIFQYDPELHDAITYDTETYEIRNSTRENIVGKYNILGAAYLPVYDEVSVDLPDVNEALTEFITGNRDIEEYDDFVQEWLDAGGSEALEEAQEAYDMMFK